MQYGVESKVGWIDAIASLPQRDIAGLFRPGLNVGSRQHPDHET
jgi:hypothetical protein